MSILGEPILGHCEKIFLLSKYLTSLTSIWLACGKFDKIQQVFGKLGMYFALGFRFLELLFMMGILGEPILGDREIIFTLSKYLTSLTSTWQVWPVNTYLLCT